MTTLDIPTSTAAPLAAHTLDELIGNTPLLRLARLDAGLPGEIYVKLDHFNIGGSAKDRIAAEIIRDAEASGQLKPGDRIIDNGAGNTAIGFVLAGIAGGHPVTLVANPSLAEGKADLLRLLGAEIIWGRADRPFSDPENWEAIAARHADEDPSTWWSHQSASAANPRAHYLGTGPEIWAQTQGRISAFIAAIATGGTVSGTGRYLRARNPEVRVIATDFVQGPNFGKPIVDVIEGRAAAPADPEWPHNIDTELIDQLIFRNKAEAIDLGWWLARTEGVVVGLTSALSLLVARDLAATAEPGEVIVAFAADHGRDYLSHEYNADWLRANGLAEIADKYQPAESSSRVATA